MRGAGGALRPRWPASIASVAIAVAIASALMGFRGVPSRKESRIPVYARRFAAEADYDALRHGYSFGVPAHAFAIAEQRKQALTQAALNLNGNSILGWTLLGPLPIINDEAVELGATAPLANVTGRITAVAIDPSSGDIFAGAAGGGVWRSIDGGLTFTEVFDSAPTQSVGSIAIDPKTSPSTIYVGTGEADESIDSYYGRGVFASTDLGTTWTALGSSLFQGMGIGSIAINHSQSPPQIFISVTNAVSGSRGAAAMPEGNSDRDGIWTSIDGGASWSQIGAFQCSNCPGKQVVVDANDSSSIWASIEFDGVYHSKDGGGSWERVCFVPTASGCALPSGYGSVGRATIALAPSAPGVVYAMIGAADGIEYAGFFKSTDNGATWTAETVPTVTIGGYVFDGTGSNNISQSFYDQALVVDPTDISGSRVIFGGVAIYGSANSGAAWTMLASGGSTQVNQHAIAPITSGGIMSGFLLANDGGLYSYSFSQGTFTPLNSSIEAAEFQSLSPHPTNPTKALGGLDDDGVVSFAGKQSWEATDYGASGIALIDPNDPSYCDHTYASLEGYPEIATSTDGCASWDAANPTAAVQLAFASDYANFFPPLTVDPAKAHRVFIGGTNAIYVSDDGMYTWRTQGAISSYNPLQDIEFAPSSDAYAWALSLSETGLGFQVFNTTQAGCPDQPGCVNPGMNAVWIDRTTSLEQAFRAGLTTADTQATGIAIDPHNPMVAWLSLSGFSAATHIGHLFRTADFGATWTEADGAGGTAPLPDIPVMRALVDRADSTGATIYAATDDGVYRSTDNGAHWAALNLGVIPAVPISDIEQSLTGTIMIGTHGRGAFCLNGPTPLPTVTSTPTVTPTTTATPTPSATITATPSRTPTPSATPTSTSTVVPTPVQTSTPTTTVVATPTATVTPTATPTITPVTQNLAYWPRRIRFASCAPGSTTKRARPHRVTLANRDKRRTASSIMLEKLQLTGDFKIDPAGTSCGNVLPPGSRCVVSLAFAPTTPGKRVGVLTIKDNAANAPQEVVLYGWGRSSKKRRSELARGFQ